MAAVHRALHEERSLIRLPAMRRTAFVTSLEVAPALQVACSRTVAARERRRQGGARPAAWVLDLAPAQPVVAAAVVTGSLGERETTREGVLAMPIVDVLAVTRACAGPPGARSCR